MKKKQGGGYSDYTIITLCRKCNLEDDVDKLYVIIINYAINSIVFFSFLKTTIYFFSLWELCYSPLHQIFDLVKANLVVVKVHLWPATANTTFQVTLIKTLTSDYRITELLPNYRLKIERHRHQSSLCCDSILYTIIRITRISFENNLCIH